MRGSLKFLLTVGILTLCVLTASPAHAQVIPTATVTSATLVAKGAAVDATLSVTCEQGLTYFASVELAQRNGKLLTRGSSGLRTLPCTGAPQESLLRITGQFPFKTGLASSITNLNICTPDFLCTSITFNEVVRVIKK